jgi:cytochrome c oxidase subunit 2
MGTWLGLPTLASEHGAEVDRLLVYFHWLMVALFVGWISYFFFALARFRRGRAARADYQGAKGRFSSYVEVGVAVVEAVLLLVFAIPAWAKVVDKFPPEKDSVVIRLAGRQFNWNARYSGADGLFGRQDATLANDGNPLGLVPDDPQGKDDIVTINQIYVPVNKPVIVHLTSLDVIHSFKVTALRLTQDAIPGMSIPTHFKATREGSYAITCAQLCGNGHYSMKGQLNVVSDDAYAQWLAQRAQADTQGTGYE